MLRGKVEGVNPSSRRSRKLLVKRGGLGGCILQPPAAFATFRRAKSRLTPAARKAGPSPLKQPGRKVETEGHLLTPSGFCYFSPREK